ncbi:MAG: acetylglutamate kinase, partial [Methanomassiliicoccaceae archaeon]|nr:acetylglutamate kinase [Methanomassiliicoccaceae archaeon]
MSSYLIKFGGNAIQGRDDLDRLSREIAQLVAGGKKIILVHGGGPEITDEISKRGMETKIAGGLRVTDAAVLKVLEEVLQRLNRDVVDSLAKAGVDAEGMSGEGVVVCVKKGPVKVMEGNKEVT